MKRMVLTSFVYFVFAMIGGVFAREFTKAFKFNGYTSLNLVHTHLLAFGTLLFLIIGLLLNQFNELEKEKLFKIFYISYNIFFPLMTLTMLVKGVTQVMGNYINIKILIEIISGLSHIFIMSSIILFFISLLKKVK